jgi:hypothetical protein
MTYALGLRQPEPGHKAAFAAGLVFPAVLALGCYGGPWPETSDLPLDPLPIAASSGAAPDSFRFAAFGDQRALADGEWQRLVDRIGSMAREDSTLLFVVDTGDIVGDGRHRDQFAMHREVTEPLSRELPYWVTVGNHELDNNRTPGSRETVGTYLSETDPSVRPDRLYYDKTVGRLRILFLDTNDMVYPGADAKGESERLRRLEAQMRWLTGRLAGDEGDSLTVVCMHHPFLQSSGKHLEQARALWSFSYGDRSLPDILLDGGADLVLCGHTHTYERFRLRRSDGKVLHLVNVSGRPRNDFLWFGASERRARNLAGREAGWLRGRGWTSLTGWTIVQEDAMVAHEADQVAVFGVSPSGLTLEVLFGGKPDAPWVLAPAVPLR